LYGAEQGEEDGRLEELHVGIDKLDGKEGLEVDYRAKELRSDLTFI
jgi:hypothetical protein